DPELHRELHVDDALVAGQHEGLAQVLVARIAAIADLDRAQLLRADDLVGFDRVRQPPGETGAVDLLGNFAEAQHDRGLAFLDDEEAARQPEQRRGHEQHHDADAGAAKRRGRATAATRGEAGAATTAATAEQAVQATIEVAPVFLEIGRAVLAVGSRPARLLVLVATASTPTGIVEREDRSNALPHGIVCLGGSGQRLAWRSGVPKSSGSDATGRWSVIASPDLLPARRAAQCS